MYEKKAKKRLAKMLRGLTGGSVLDLMAQVFLDLAAEARREGNDTAAEQFTMAHNALVVVGLGIDAICPR
jgi:hypothetical protein